MTPAEPGEDVLVVVIGPRYAGIQAGKYAGEITCLLGAERGGRAGGGRVSDRPASNSM